MSVTGPLALTDVTIYAALATILSMVTFGGILVWMLTRTRDEIEYTARLPLDSEQTPAGEGERTNT